MKQLNRREFVASAGAGAATIATVATAATAAAFQVAGTTASEAHTAEPSEPTANPHAALSATLIAPLTEGSALGRWTVQRVLPVTDGALSIVAVDQAGRAFQLDVCARDAGATGPGRTEHFDVLLANHGDGLTSTNEDHGLAAMALADVIRSNEQRVDRSAFKTLTERLARQAARVHVT